MLDNTSSIAILGSAGMVGSSIVRTLKSSGWNNILEVTRKQIDLTNQNDVNEWYAYYKPCYVIVTAAKVGGIYANNTYPAEFIYDNLAIACNTINGAWKNNVERLLFLGSSCIYPKLTEQPMKEESLLTGSLEPTNEAYAIAKIAGLRMCDFYRQQYGCKFFSAMPTNLYGIGDNFHLQNSHVIPGLIRKFYEAVRDKKTEVVCWGSGNPRREFLHVDDLSQALLFIMENFDGPGHINVGTGEDISIKELTEYIAKISGFTGNIVWDSNKPDGTYQKLLDVSCLHKLGWKHSISLYDGLEQTYNWFSNNYNNVRL